MDHRCSIANEGERRHRDSLADGTPSNCGNTASGTALVNGIAVGGGYAYLSALNPTQTGYQVDVCTVNSDGSLTGCSSTATFTAPQQLLVH